MSRLLEIQEQLLGTASEITRLERALGQQNSRALTSSLKSLYKAYQGLEAEFTEAAATAQVDVVSYRLFDGRERPTMSLVGKAMDSFQTLYAILYSAISAAHPKDTSHLNSSTLRETAFEFSYAYPGSVGFVFTLPNDRLLFGETKLDEAMGGLFAIANAATSDDVKSFAKRFGLAPVRALYSWVNALCVANTGADVQWQKNESRKGRLLLQPAQVTALRDLIAATSDLQVDDGPYEGILLGYDSQALAFRFEPSDGNPVMRGRIAEGASVPSAVTIPKRYHAIIRTFSKTKYSTDQQEITHELLHLAKI
jgi:hypothetical protein